MASTARFTRPQPARSASPWRQLLALAGLAMALLAPWGSALADDDPPGRVGRVSIVDGGVALEDNDNNETVEAPRNWPVSSGDVLVTGPGARAEVQIGSTSLRLDQNTRLEFTRIDDAALQFSLRQGSFAMAVRSPEVAQETEVLLPMGRLVPQGPGLYRIDRDANFNATALRGNLQFEARDMTVVLREGQRAEFFGEDRAGYRPLSLERDDFAAWSGEMPAQVAQASVPRGEPVGVPIGRPAGTPVGVPVSSEMTGYEDLQRHGNWETVTDYGYVWFPTTVVAGWAPYRHGRWAWVRPWGWTWIDEAPWGFAPFHYGRWVWWRDRWGWVPGSYVARPVYAPALVAWVGSPGASVSVAVGPGVGWFPLAPREVYVPVYRCTPRYVQTINITHVARIGNVELIVREPQVAIERYRYRYGDDHRAVSMLPPEAWRERRPIATPIPAPRDYDRWRDRDRDGGRDRAWRPPVMLAPEPPSWARGGYEPRRPLQSVPITAPPPQTPGRNPHAPFVVGPAVPPPQAGQPAPRAPQQAPRRGDRDWISAPQPGPAVRNPPANEPIGAPVLRPPQAGRQQPGFEPRPQAPVVRERPAPEAPVVRERPVPTAPVVRERPAQPVQEQRPAPAAPVGPAAPVVRERPAPQVNPVAPAPQGRDQAPRGEREVDPRRHDRRLLERERPQ